MDKGINPKDKTTIIPFFKAHPSIAIALFPIVVAVITTLLHFVSYISSSRLLKYWNLDIHMVGYDSNGLFYLISFSFVSIAILLVLQLHVASVCELFYKRWTFMNIVKQIFAKAEEDPAVSADEVCLNWLENKDSQTDFFCRHTKMMLVIQFMAYIMILFVVIAGLSYMAYTVVGTNLPKSSILYAAISYAGLIILFQMFSNIFVANIGIKKKISTANIK